MANRKKDEKIMISESQSNLEAGSDLSLDLEPELQDSFPIAAIGASAGGLEAFTELLANLPNDTGMGFVLIQHLAPEHDSQLSEILRRTTEMPVNQAQEGMRIVPNSVYVIPPNTLMTLEQGILRLEPRRKVRGKFMVIDGFFSSLAADRGENAIAVLLSGNNEDGTVGLGVIKSVGGVTFAQELSSAEYPTMPMIAIASGYVDMVLAPDEIAAELVIISQKVNESMAVIDAEVARDEIDTPSTGIFVNSGETLAYIFALLLNRMGVDFSNYKQGTIRRRIARRMGLLNLKDLEAYREFLQVHPDEVEKLYHDILINVTSFFREPESFKVLQELVFPAICEYKSVDAPIRIWVAGCSTGEEVYSIAMSLLEFFGDRPAKHPIQIFATDISEVAISKARLGIYNHQALVDISPERLRQFFTQVQDGYQIGKSVRELCVFARQNLTSDPPFSRLDLISCRNMLIYLEPVLQKKVMPIFHYALNPNGFLMLGSSEGIGSASELFAIADKKNRIYNRKPTAPQMNFNFVKSTYVKQPEIPAKRSLPESESNLEQIADQIVLNQYAPVGVIVNVDLDILQFRGQTSLYLEAAAGKASLNLLKMARPELMLELRSLLYDAKKQNIPITKDDIPMSSLLVKINVIPIQNDNETCFLVLFESRAQPILSTNPVSAPVSKSRKERQNEVNIEIARLTHELFKTKEYLRAIIESQEATNQDLKVASEEYLSSNEELQSANEELETAKEEIQATNEELSTVNEEMRDRNTQLSFVNNDLQNLLKSVNIPILMLSGDLRIRRFTPLAEQAFNLIASDVGRPFSDIQTNIGVPNLMGLVSEVLDTLIPFEQDVQSRTGHWDILRIRPYRTTDNVIDGVVISLFDIDLPEMIYADEKRLKQVILNLLSNAIKFTSAGQITFSVRKKLSDLSAPNLIQFAIADTGTGIAAPELAKIFLPFEQVGEVAVKTEGTGLGLAISQDIINRMGGEITVVSQIGVGSIFSFELDLSTPPTMGLSPLSIPESPPNPQSLISGAIDSSTPPQTTNLLEAESPLTPSPSPAGEESPLTSSLSPTGEESPLTPSPSPAGEGDKRTLSILVAEDVIYNQMLIKLFLQKLGYQPDIVSNGLEVLAKLREKRYDVILMDIQMPQMDGMEATRRIVAGYPQSDRPYIIAVSANSSGEDQAQYLALGMNDAIAKPYVLDELQQALSRFNP